MDDYKQYVLATERFLGRLYDDNGSGEGKVNQHFVEELMYMSF